MNATEARQVDGFLSLLAAPGRSSGIPEAEDVYGWLVGSWELEVLHYKGVDVSAHRISGEAHFSWVLEGRAIQDVWITPRCSVRHPDLAGARPDGTATRWRFTEITADSFHWIGEALEPDGHTWKLEGEFRARRID